jgi:hypothetical protein
VPRRVEHALERVEQYSPLLLSEMAHEEADKRAVERAALELLAKEVASDHRCGCSAALLPRVE